MIRLILFSLSLLFSTTSLAEEPCRLSPPDWNLLDVCYETDLLIRTERGEIWFWRPNDRERKELEGTATPPAAALVLKTDQKEELVYRYCPNGCWAAENIDPLPKIIKIRKKQYAVWAPDNRLSNRHGTSSKIELLNITDLSLKPISDEIYIHWYEEDPLSIDYTEGTFITVKAIKFDESEDPDSVEYTTEKYLHKVDVSLPPYYYQEDRIHPLVIEEFIGWISDSRSSPTVSIDLAAAQQASNEYFGDVYKTHDAKICHDKADINDRAAGFFCYELIDQDPKGNHLFRTYSNGGGSATFINDLLIHFHSDKQYDFKSKTWGKRDLMTLLGRKTVNPKKPEHIFN